MLRALKRLILKGEAKTQIRDVERRRAFNKLLKGGDLDREVVETLNQLKNFPNRASEMILSWVDTPVLLTLLEIKPYLRDDQQLRDDQVELIHAIIKGRIERGDETILKAASDGEISFVRVLLEMGADKEVKDTVFGWTPLHRAAQKGHTDIVKLLLDLGADKDLKDKFGSTPLHHAAGYFAAHQGHINVVELLLDAGVDKEEKEYLGRTPLYFAAWKGNTRIVQMLLNRGVEKDVQDSYNQTPLHAAAMSGRTEVVELLVDAGADKDVKDSDDKTPLQLAEKIGHDVIVALLRKRDREGDDESEARLSKRRKTRRG